MSWGRSLAEELKATEGQIPVIKVGKLSNELKMLNKLVRLSLMRTANRSEWMCCLNDSITRPIE
jgi:hypothetical protein